MSNNSNGGSQRDRSNGAQCLRARRGSASSKDEPKAQKHLLAPREKGKGKLMQNNNPIAISDTIADILYNKIQAKYKKFGKPVMHITDFEVFQAALESRNPANIWFYNAALVAQSLNKIKGVSAAYFCENADELDGEITVVLTEYIK